MNKEIILVVSTAFNFFEGGNCISRVDLKFKSAFRPPIKTPPCASVCQRGFGRTLGGPGPALCGGTLVTHGGAAGVGVLANLNCFAPAGGLELVRDQVCSAELL